jgi:hypothetical protein
MADDKNPTPPVDRTLERPGERLVLIRRATPRTGQRRKL